MKVTPYLPESDYARMCHWLLTHGAYVPAEDELPAIGYVATNDEGTPVAAAFLRMVEGGYGHFDGLVTNPDCSAKDRNAGIEAVTREVLLRAKQDGLRSVIAYSEDKGTLMRSQRHGFRPMAYTMIGLDLKDYK